MPPNLICPKCKFFLQPDKGGYACSNCGIFYPIIDNIICFMDKKDRKDITFNKEMSRVLYEVEEKHFWHIGRKEIIYQMAENCFKGKITGLKMLEIGCGNGNILRYFREKGINIEGGDISPASLNLCKKRVNAPLYQFDADDLNLPFPDESYDIVGMFDLIEHIDRDDKLLKEAFRICKKNGVLIITVPANKSFWSYFDLISGHKRRYGRKDMVLKMEKAGFAAEKISFYMFFLALPLWLFRKMNNFKKLSANSDIGALGEFKNMPVLNDIFLLLLRLEKLLLKRTNLPFGASLVCVGRKSG